MEKRTVKLETEWGEVFLEYNIYHCRQIIPICGVSRILRLILFVFQNKLMIVLVMNRKRLSFWEILTHFIT